MVVRKARASNKTRKETKKAKVRAKPERLYATWQQFAMLLILSVLILFMLIFVGSPLKDVIFTAVILGFVNVYILLSALGKIPLYKGW